MRTYLMNAKQKLHQAHLREWTAHFTDQKASGLTVHAWCEQNQISIHKYSYWKHILKEEVVDQALPEIVPLSLPASFTFSDPAALQTVGQDHTMTNRANHAIRTNCTNANAVQASSESF